LIAKNVQKFWSYQSTVYSPLFEKEGLGEIIQINPPYALVGTFSKGALFFCEILTIYTLRGINPEIRRI
jgi:hypothetical protein